MGGIADLLQKDTELDKELWPILQSTMEKEMKKWKQTNIASLCQLNEWQENSAESWWERRHVAGLLFHNQENKVFEF